MNYSYKLVNLCNKKSHNLHLTRFIAACLVIISHAFPLSSGNYNGEWLIKITNGQLSLGTLSVYLFFLCGGFLISKNNKNHKTFHDFFYARFLRIFPSLFLCIVLTILTGSLLSYLTISDYYKSAITWKYFLNTFLVLQHTLPGVFESNIYTSTVNGSLWTLPVEVICYLVCYLIYKIKIFRKDFCLTLLPATFGFILLTIISKQVPIFFSVIGPCLQFYIGMFFWYYREKIVLSVHCVILLSIILLILSKLNILAIGLFLCMPYIAFFIWFHPCQISSKISILGNYSYEIYLTGFPIQQAVVSFYEGKMSPLINILITLPISFLFAMLLNFISEKVTAFLTKYNSKKVSTYSNTNN